MRLISLFLSGTLWELTGRQIGTEARAMMNLGTATSTSYWTISEGYLGSLPPHTRRALCSTWLPCLLDADWRLRSDVMTASCLQGTCVAWAGLLFVFGGETSNPPPAHDQFASSRGVYPQTRIFDIAAVSRREASTPSTISQRGEL